MRIYAPLFTCWTCFADENRSEEAIEAPFHECLHCCFLAYWFYFNANGLSSETWLGMYTFKKNCFRKLIYVQSKCYLWVHRTLRGLRQRLLTFWNDIDASSARGWRVIDNRLAMTLRISKRGSLQWKASSACWWRWIKANSGGGLDGELCNLRWGGPRSVTHLQVLCWSLFTKLLALGYLFTWFRSRSLTSG
jgi:hypothetical protein